MNILNQEMIKLEKEGKIEIKDTVISGTKGYSPSAGRVLNDDEKEHIVFSKIKTDEEIEMERRQEKSKEADEDIETIAN